jgi:hypothetical protein
VGLLRRSFAGGEEGGIDHSHTANLAAWRALPAV